MSDADNPPQSAAGNGLLHRRAFLKAGAASSLTWLSAAAAATTPSERPRWMRTPGAAMSGYGQPSAFESRVKRLGISSAPGTTGSGVSFTPLEQLQGTITPSGLHFERHHSGVPEIDPSQHTLLVHGLVKNPLLFSMDALTHYPLHTRSCFLECSGNSFALLAASAPARSCGEIHGLVSSTEWTGIHLATILSDVGIDPDATWLVAEGADAAMMSRSVPLAKALDDAMLVLYQNGERLRPENGYPLRLLLPGWEGNMSVKWLRRLQLTNQPAMTRDETSKYSDLQADGQARLFTFEMGVKSVITHPSGEQQLPQPGLYQISGLAWSGAGKIQRVEVSADGGRSWADAELETPILTKQLTRFRAPWQWQGQPAVLLSRATDETGAKQPRRVDVLQGRAANNIYHYNGMQAWQVDTRGAVHNLYV